MSRSKRLKKLERFNGKAGLLPICPPGMSYQEFCDLFIDECF